MGRKKNDGTRDIDFLLGNALAAMRNMERVYRTAYGTHTAEECSSTEADKCGKTPEKRL